MKKVISVCDRYRYKFFMFESFFKIRFRVIYNDFIEGNKFLILFVDFRILYILVICFKDFFLVYFIYKIYVINFEKYIYCFRVF